MSAIPSIDDFQLKTKALTGMNVTNFTLSELLFFVFKTLDNKAFDSPYKHANFGGWPVRATDEARELYYLHVALARHYKICACCSGNNIDESLTNGADYDMRVGGMCDSCSCI